MEQLKEERAKEEVVQRLYDWELSKKARIEEAQHAAAPAFTPQPYASARRSEYDHAELDEPEAGPDLADRCFEWSHNREEWLKVCSTLALLFQPATCIYPCTLACKLLLDSLW
jgi:transcription termination factor NusB